MTAEVQPALEVLDLGHCHQVGCEVLRLTYHPAERRGVIECPASTSPNDDGAVALFRQLDRHCLTVDVCVGGKLWKTLERGKHRHLWRAS